MMMMGVIIIKFLFLSLLLLFIIIVYIFFSPDGLELLLHPFLFQYLSEAGISCYVLYKANLESSKILQINYQSHGLWYSKNWHLCRLSTLRIKLVW